MAEIITLVERKIQKLNREIEAMREANRRAAAEIAYNDELEAIERREYIAQYRRTQYELIVNNTQD